MESLKSKRPIYWRQNAVVGEPSGKNLVDSEEDSKQSPFVFFREFISRRVMRGATCMFTKVSQRCKGRNRGQKVILIRNEDDSIILEVGVNRKETI